RRNSRSRARDILATNRARGTGFIAFITIVIADDEQSVGIQFKAIDMSIRTNQVGSDRAGRKVEVLSAARIGRAQVCIGEDSGNNFDVRPIAVPNQGTITALACRFSANYAGILSVVKCGKARTGEVRSSEVRAGEIGRAEIRLGEARLTEVSVRQCGLDEV